MAHSSIDTQHRGRNFLAKLMWGFAAAVVIYVLLHIVHPASETMPEATSFVQLDAFGRATIVSAPDIDWYVGKAKSLPLLAALDARNKEIDPALAAVRETLAEMDRRTTNALVGDLQEVGRAISRGEFQEARQRLQTTVERLSPTTLQSIGQAELFDLQDRIIRLERLQGEQRRDVRLLQPPRYTLVFWASPAWSLFEVVFWSWFGVLANLLLNVAEAIRANQYRPHEMSVGYAKLAYGPILSVVIVLAIMTGWVDAGGYETRVWALPLLGFLFGFNSRKTADLIDRLSEQLFRSVGKSIDEGPAAVAQRYDARMKSILDTLEPVSFGDLKTKAKIASEQAIRTEVGRISGVHS